MGHRPSFRLLDHTADMGIEVREKSLKSLFRISGLSLCSLIYRMKDVRGGEVREVSLHGGGPEELLVSFLQEIIFLTITRKFLVKAIDVTDLSGTHLSATISGEGFDPKRHRYISEIKAATYHDLRIFREGEEYVARVIFDV